MLKDTSSPTERSHFNPGGCGSVILAPPPNSPNSAPNALLKPMFVILCAATMSQVQKLTTVSTPDSADNSAVAETEENMESVARISKLPVVEQSLNAASNIYGKVKDSNSVIRWTLNTAESTVNKAIETAAPVTSRLEGPIKKVDTLLCSSLDFVESKVPAVKLPPQQIFENTKHYVCETVKPAVECACAVKDYGAKKLADLNLYSSKEGEDKENDADGTASQTSVEECADCKAQIKVKSREMLNEEKTSETHKT
uniref:Uncharacterized protein n=1 Tax=Timema genevievae TaxID=629358 RepID=A0A7R9K183_TIMGE|nr:unnamed protein product [Timema genevievae]